MKRFFSMVLCLCLAVSAFGCNKTDDKTYKISWYDGTEICSIEVATGELFSMPSIPEREGYEFVGLFDAEEDGTMFADATGMAVNPWKEKNDKRLYVRWRPIETALFLDYQGGIEGEKRLSVCFDTQLPLFPVSYKEHHEFKGWFTQPDCQGVRLADDNGVPLVSSLGPEYFNIQTTVYAGFEGSRFKVTFYIGNGNDMKEIVVTAQYQQKLSDVQPMELFENKAVLSWSTNMNGGGEIYTSNSLLTDEIKLYSQEFAPVIRFETGGGASVSPVIAKEGTIVSLPQAKREGCVFGGWETETGTPCPQNWTITESVILHAVWLRSLTLHGASINSTANYRAGAQITLQTDHRSNSNFAGWYDEERNRVSTNFVMPDANVTLRAGWYDRKTSTQTIQADEIKAFQAGASYKPYKTYTVVLGFRGTQTFSFQMKCTKGEPHFAVYSDSGMTYLLGKLDMPQQAPDWAWYSLTLSNIGGTVYVKFYDNHNTGLAPGYPGYIKDFSVSCSYTSSSLTFS